MPDEDVSSLLLPPALRPVAVAGRAAVVVLAAAALLAAPPPAEAKKKPKDASDEESVEYAVRWSSAEGGLQSAAAALQHLGLTPKKEGVTFKVRYFDLPTPAGTPDGFKAILRQRGDGEETQLTFKLRGPDPYPAASSPLAAWRCPLPAADKRKDEADVSFLAGGEVKTVHSRSCTQTTANRSTQPPAGLQAQPKPCEASMRRLEAKHDKVETTAEEWQLGDGGVLVEVSRKGGDAKDFRKQVVDPLVDAGIHPLDRSKSELGSDCR